MLAGHGGEHEEHGGSVLGTGDVNPKAFQIRIPGHGGEHDEHDHHDEHRGDINTDDDEDDDLEDLDDSEEGEMEEGEGQRCAGSKLDFDSRPWI